MRLINATTLRLEDFSLKPKPGYAILSHTWEVDEEVSYQEMLNRSNPYKKGWDKIRNTCARALTNRLYYVWIDTCCIDKTSSAELSEAINSMFAWYRDAEECYAFLSDLPSNDHFHFHNCRWLTRGWTLQELIAPRRLIFLNAKWTFAGSREDRCYEIARHTNIPVEVLRHERRLTAISIAARMSWASNRSTTRKEDEAYCLLGLFDINMPLIYGEGTKAFTRLQEEIIKRSDDLSILAGHRQRDLLAESPRAFAACVDIGKTPGLNEIPAGYTITNIGLRFPGQVELSVVACTIPGSGRASQIYALRVGTQRSNPMIYVCLCLRKVAPAVYERHPGFPCTAFQDLSTIAGVVCESQICILGKTRSHDQIQDIQDTFLDYGHTVYIRAKDEFQLKAVRPQLLWDVETRRISDQFEYDPLNYYDCVNIALMSMEHESDSTYVLIYWWADKTLNGRGWSGGGNLRVCSLHVVSKLEESVRWLNRNRSNRIFMEDFLKQFSIENRHPSAAIEIEIGGKPVVLRSRLVQRDIVNVYDLQLDVADPSSTDPPTLCH